MTFWSGETLKARLPELISSYDARNIDCAAYRLQIGPEIYVSPTSDADDPKTRSKRQLALGESFAVPPGQFAFLLTEEVIKIPRDALAFISIPSNDQVPRLGQCFWFPCRPGLSWPARLLGVQRRPRSRSPGTGRSVLSHLVREPRSRYHQGQGRGWFSEHSRPASSIRSREKSSPSKGFLRRSRRTTRAQPPG